MRTNISVIAETTRPLSTGEFPLAIRLHKDNRRRYVRLGISLTPKYWDEKKGKIKSNCPNLEYFNGIIHKKMDLFQKQVWEFQTLNKPYTLDQLIDSVEKPIAKTTLEEFLSKIITELKSTNHIGNAGHYEVLLNSLRKFSNPKKLLFTDIDIKFLTRYQEYLDGLGNMNNTIHTRFKTLKATYNKAIKDKIVKKENSPFIEFNVGKLQEKTAKRAILKEDIVRIMSFDVNRLIKKPWSSMQLAKEIFLFSYFGCGINLIDIAFLERDNRIGDRITYKRSKTDKVINFQLHPYALEILAKYEDSKRKYLFPILDDNVHYSSEQQYRRIKKMTYIVNKSLKQIGEDLKLPIKLTTYVARHSYATVLKRSGVNTSIISESLGHSSEKVTQIYLDSFENSQIDEAMKNLL